MGNEKIVLGVDFGTSNSVAAFFDSDYDENNLSNPIHLIPLCGGSEQGDNIFPSCIAYDDGELLYGEEAKRFALTDKSNSILEIKKELGGNKRFRLGDEEYSPTDIASMILKKIKSESEKYLFDNGFLDENETLDDVVITFPAGIKDNKRRATKKAARLAGFKEVKTIQEPTAAGIAYGFNKEDNLNIMVFDFGAGTLDVSLMEVNESNSKVNAIEGAAFGGSDMDELIVSYFVEQFEKENGIVLEGDVFAERKLKLLAEKAKIDLSEKHEVEVKDPNIILKDSYPVPFKSIITRDKLNELVEDIVKKSGEIIQKALNLANMDKKDVDKIILVGGPTKMPIVQDFIKTFMGNDFERGVDPMECVAVGAAIKGKYSGGPVPDDVVPHSLGIETLGGSYSVILPKNSKFGVNKTRRYKTSKDNQNEVDINVYQGEDEIAENNELMGEFVFSGITPAPKSVSKFIVKIGYDEEGFIDVSVKDLTSDRELVKVIGDNNLDIRNLKPDSELEPESTSKCIEEIKKVIYDIDSFLNNSSDIEFNFHLELLKMDLTDLLEDLKEANDEDKESYIDKIYEKIDEIREKLE